MKNVKSKITFLLILILSLNLSAQYEPKNLTQEQNENAARWVDKTYENMTQSERLGQLFIIALYTNKGEDYINLVRNLVINENIGGLILMQDDAAREINLVNEFQAKSKIPLMIGMDAEWGLYQRIPTAHKFPWAMTLGAIQDKNLIYDMASQIAKDCERMGINWDFAPVVDVNTNPNNPIIGNRSFGSEVKNVISSATAYFRGLQDHQILAAMKHFPGHGDADTDSHLDLPVINQNLKRLKKVELAPFKALAHSGIGGVMVAHLYVPALENKKIPASLSYEIVTNLLQKKIGYKGLVITDALNMGAVAKQYQPGEVDEMAFKAGNDILLFSNGVQEAKKRIQKDIDQGIISQERLEKSVKKILLTKYYLGLSKYSARNAAHINEDLNTQTHVEIARNLYSNALTLLKDERTLLPLNCKETYYYVPLEEANYESFLDKLKLNHTIILKKSDEIQSIPKNSKVIVGFHKDNSTAYKPYKISAESQAILRQLNNNQQVILVVFGSPYALKDVDISKTSTVLVAYENNEDSLIATAEALSGKTKIHGRIPVLVNENIKEGMGKDLEMTRDK